MKAEFNELVNVMKKYDLYHKDDEVDLAMQSLEAKLDEVLKRMVIVRACGIEIHKLSQFLEDTTIMNASFDIGVAMDLSDERPIEENWHGLFAPKKILNETIPLCTFESSWGSITCDLEGNVIEIIGDEEINGERNYLYDIKKFNTKEYCAYLVENNITSGERSDILCVSFWKKDGTYSEYNKEVRDGEELKPIAVGNVEYDFPQDVFTIGNADNTEIIGDVYESDFDSLCKFGLICVEGEGDFVSGKTNYIVKENDFIPLVKLKQIDLALVPIKKQVEVVPTFQCRDTQTHDKVKEIIQSLRTLHNGDCVDGETIGYIISELGFNDYLLKALIFSSSNNHINDLLADKKEHFGY